MPRAWSVKSELNIMPIYGSGNALVREGIEFFVWLNDPPVPQIDLDIILQHPENQEWGAYGSRFISISTSIEKVSDVAVPMHGARNSAPEDLYKKNGTIYCPPLLLPTCLGGDPKEAFKMRFAALGQKLEDYHVPSERKIDVRSWMACGYCSQEPSTTWFERTEDGSELTELGLQNYATAKITWDDYIRKHQSR
jgi:hypothetical protein